MHAQEIEFVVRSRGGVVTEVGKSTVFRPKAYYSGEPMKWHMDKLKTDTRKSTGEDEGDVNGTDIG